MVSASLLTLAIVTALSLLVRSVVLAEASDPTESTPVVKRTGPDDWEFWETRDRFRARRKTDGTYAEFWDYKTFRKATYDAKRGCIMVALCDPPTGGVFIDSTLDGIRSWYASTHPSLKMTWKEEEISLEGRTVLKVTPADDSRSYYKSILADPKTRRILKAVTREGEADYSYPESGPSDIYEKYLATTPIVLPRAHDPAQGYESEVIEWGRLRPGQWYPAVIRTWDIVRGEDGEWQEREGSLRYRLILAEPLDRVDDQWFEAPPARGPD